MSSTPYLDSPILFDRLPVLERLGGGLQTDVWLVDTSSLPGFPSRAAIKTLKPPLAVSSARTRIEHEGALLSRFSHPGVERLFGIGRWGDEPALALEYLPRPLFDQAGGEPSALSDLCDLARHLVALFRYLHVEHPDAPVIHGDIRQANLRRREDGSPVLFDFGSASRRGCPAPEGLGTHPVLASPARLEGGFPCTLDDRRALRGLFSRWSETDTPPGADFDSLKELIRSLTDPACSG